MAFARNAGFTSAIATDPADTAAGLLTPARFNLPDVVSGATVGGIPYCPTATSEKTSSDLTFNDSTAILTLGGSTAGAGLVVTGGTITASSPLFSGTQTWNNAAVAFTSDLINVTNTASAAGSKIWDRQIGGVSKVAIYAQDSPSSQPLFQIGSGNGATKGISIGNGASAACYLWGTDVAPTTGNYTFAFTNGAAVYVSQGAHLFQTTQCSLTNVFASAVNINSGGSLVLGNAYVGTPQVATGYIVIKDSTGTAYKVSCNL